MIKVVHCKLFYLPFLLNQNVSVSTPPLHVSKEEEPLVLFKGKCKVLDFVFPLLCDLALSVFLSSSCESVILPYLRCLFLLNLQPQLNFSSPQTAFSHL